MQNVFFSFSFDTDRGLSVCKCICPLNASQATCNQEGQGYGVRLKVDHTGSITVRHGQMSVTCISPDELT